VGERVLAGCGTHPAGRGVGGRGGAVAQPRFQQCRRPAELGRVGEEHEVVLVDRRRRPDGVVPLPVRGDDLPHRQLVEDRPEDAFAEIAPDRQLSEIPGQGVETPSGDVAS
jgi:hypothetical protein